MTADTTSTPVTPPTTRIAPSPTGRMHAGNVFATLLTWLIARREGGTVLLRIEDIDTGRARPAFSELIVDDLEWLGLRWDGPVVHQSARTDLYLQALDILHDHGLLYPCFCTRADLHAASAPHASDGDLVYPGTCRGLDAAQRALRSSRRAPAWRLRVPDAGDARGIVRFHDQLQGSVECDLGRAVGDFIVRRSDGLFAYQLAVVVDDLVQGVDCIVRGCDLLESTPQQLYLRHLLAEGGMGPQVPTTGTAPGMRTAADTADASIGSWHMTFHHLPLLVDGAGRRLSKRDGDCDMGQLRERFRTPQALLGHIAHISGIVEGADRAMDLDELVATFSTEPLKTRWTVAWR